MMAPARARLLDFVRDFAEGAKVLDMPYIHPAGAVAVHEWLGGMFAARRSW